MKTKLGRTIRKVNPYGIEKTISRMKSEGSGERLEFHVDGTVIQYIIGTDDDGIRVFIR